MALLIRLTSLQRLTLEGFHGRDGGPGLERCRINLHYQKPGH
jgi:hypothetical protein